MGYARRTRAIAVAACVVAGVAVLAAYLGGFASRRPPADIAPPAHAAVPVPVPVVVVRPAVPAPPAPIASTCPTGPLVPARGPRDGRFLPQPAPASDARSSAFLAVAREAQQLGRARDAEVALLAACRAAERDAGARSAPVADVKSQLGAHYVALAAREPAEATRLALRQRATQLWDESAQAYAAALGRTASRTRMAQQRLASIQEEEPVGPDTARMGAARDLSAPTEAQLRALRTVPALVRSDPELAQLDGDVQRLQAQARRMTRDPAGLRRREAQALAQRDARCQDKACLRNWYLQRRRQLLAEFF